MRGADRGRAPQYHRRARASCQPPSRLVRFVFRLTADCKFAKNGNKGLNILLFAESIMRQPGPTAPPVKICQFELSVKGLRAAMLTRSFVATQTAFVAFVTVRSGGKLKCIWRFHSTFAPKIIWRFVVAFGDFVSFSWRKQIP